MISGKCIVCEGDKNGYTVLDDRVISTIRAIKRRLNIAKGHKLIVCPGCIDSYRKKRADFEGALVRYGLIGAFILVMLVGVPIFFGGGFNLASILTGVFLALLITAFSLFRYYPAAEIPADAHSPATAVQQQSQVQQAHQQPAYEAPMQPQKPGLLSSLLGKRQAQQPLSPSKPRHQPAKKKKK